MINFKIFSLFFFISSIFGNSFLPVQNFWQGNKRRIPNPVIRPYKLAGDGCQLQLTDAKVWDNGMSFDVNVFNDGSIESNRWSVKITFNKPVKSFTSFNGNAEKISALEYKVTNTDWNQNISPGASVNLNAIATFFENETIPKVSRLVFHVNGEKTKDIACDKGDDEQPAAFIPPPKEQIQNEERNPNKRGVYVQWPEKILGLYVLLADDYVENFETRADNWEPRLYPWQQETANVLFFTFIHPESMEVPLSYQKLTATRGTNEPGAVPKDTVIMFAIGGYAYSIRPNPWWWLETKEAAVEMAEKVAEWPQKYNCDGIDLDLEEGAGDHDHTGANMIHFIRRLRELQPRMIISQPTYGIPAIKAEIDVINASWDSEGNYQNLADSIGIMVYKGTEALNYVENYSKGADQWKDHPIKVNVPSNRILVGGHTKASPSTLRALAQASVDEDLLGLMFWCAPVKDGFYYGGRWHFDEKSIQAFRDARMILAGGQ